MRPTPAAIIAGTTRLVTRNVPRMLMSNTRSHSAVVTSRKSMGELTPAALTRPMIGGRPASTWAMAALTESSSATSAATPSAATDRSAVARPMPRRDAAPVMTAVRSPGKGLSAFMACCLSVDRAVRRPVPSEDRMRRPSAMPSHHLRWAGPPTCLRSLPPPYALRQQARDRQRECARDAVSRGSRRPPGRRPAAMVHWHGLASPNRASTPGGREKETSVTEALRRFGGERSQPRPLTVVEAGELSGSFHAGYPQLVLVATTDGWSVAVEDNGFEGGRPEVLRALSGGTQAVSVLDNDSEGHFSYAADGRVLVQFELLFPQRRWGSQPDLLLLPQMRAVGLDPDWQQPPPGELDTAALALAKRVTGVHLDPSMLDGPLLAAEIAPLLDDPPASFFLDGEDAELAAAIEQAAPGVLQPAAATAARQAVQLAQLDQDPVVVETLAATEAGQAGQVDDH